LLPVRFVGMSGFDRAQGPGTAGRGRPHGLV